MKNQNSQLSTSETLNMVRERPMLMCGEMVVAALRDLKTETRRIVKPQPHPEFWDNKIACETYEPIVVRKGMQVPGKPVFGFASENEGWVCPYGKPGERLWVKETFRLSTPADCDCPERCSCKSGVPIYRATCGFEKDSGDPPWKPSIFMPRWASRITLEITGMRAERLQEITEEGAIAEGIEKVTQERWGGGIWWHNYQFKTAHPRNGVVVRDELHRIQAFKDPIRSYQSLWEKINGAGSWAKNPWVWVVKFRRVQSIHLVIDSSQRKLVKVQP